MDERKWLNDYHAETLQKVRPLLEKFDDKRAISWLDKECRAI
jgi:Xaa-Pro aminopeptidase